MFLDSLDKKETPDFLVRVEFLEIVETLVRLVFPEILVFLQPPSW